MSGGEGEFDKVDQDTGTIGLVVRHGEKLITELGGDTAVGSIICPGVLPLNPIVPIDICNIILIGRRVATE